MTTPPIRPLKSYFLVWLALLLLLLAAVAGTRLPLGGFNLVLNLAIATVMALLVLVFFMELRDSGSLIRIAAAAGFFWLLLLISLSLSDYLTRVAIPSPW